MMAALVQTSAETPRRAASGGDSQTACTSPAVAPSQVIGVSHPPLQRFAA
jgi:hypothetical protein